MKVRPCISGLLAGLLALITLIPSAQAADLSVSPRPVPPINTASRESVSDAYNNFFLPLVEQVNTNGIGWTGSVANCLAGSTNDIGRTMTLEAINYFRAMTGLGALAENTTFTSQAQLAALYLAANPQRGLPSDHVLSPDGACYSAAGAEAALNANLAQGVVGPEAVAAFIRDDTGTASQANRSRVGHRRWLLDPGQTEIGLAGAMADDEPATGFTVLRIDPQADPSSSSSQRFPNQGYFPAELLSPTTAWSYSLGRADFSAATVSVTHNGQAVAVNQKPVSNGAGANTLVWELADFATPVGLAQDRYQVSITGISGGARSSDNYEVVLFNAHPTVSAGRIGYSESRLNAQPYLYRTLTVQPYTTGNLPWHAEDQTVTFSYQWYRGDQPITGQTAASYQGQLADLGQTIWVEITGSAAGWWPVTVAVDEFTVVTELPQAWVGFNMERTVRPDGSLVIGQPINLTNLSTLPQNAPVSLTWIKPDGTPLGNGLTYQPSNGDACATIGVVAEVNVNGWLPVRYTHPAGQVESPDAVACAEPEPWPSLSPSLRPTPPASSHPSSGVASPFASLPASANSRTTSSTKPSVGASQNPTVKTKLKKTARPQTARKVTGRSGKTKLKIKGLRSLATRQLQVQRWDSKRARWVSTAAKRKVSRTAAAKGYLTITLPRVKTASARFRVSVKATKQWAAAVSQTVTWRRAKR